MLVPYIRGTPLPEHLEPLYRRFNPTAAQLEHANPWTDVRIDPDPGAVVQATGRDSAGRLQRIYSPEHVAQASSGKFQRVRCLLSEWEDIRTQIEGDLNSKELSPKWKEAALVAYLVYETGIRPGSNADTLAQVKAYGATTLQLRHAKRCARGVRLKYVGKKGVSQNVLVTNPYLARVMMTRKRESTSWSSPLFQVSATTLNAYIGGLGSGGYTAKDFRTARGTSLALELLGSRKRVPKVKSRRRRIVNDALDRVARLLGNTRAVSRKSYVDPDILARFL